jgi:hypothetical protein
MGKNSNQRKDDVATQKMRALERAVKDLMLNFDDTNIHGMVNCIMRGWIVDGRFTEDYLKLIAQAQAEYEQAQAKAAAAQAEVNRPQIIVDTSSL